MKITVNEAQRLTLSAINKVLAARHVELVKGRGYFYYTFDDGDRFDTQDVYVYKLTDQPFETWVRGGEAFADEMETRPTASSAPVVFSLRQRT